MMWCIKNKISWFVQKIIYFVKSSSLYYKNARNKKNLVNYVFNIVFNNKNVNIVIIDMIWVFFVYEHINGELK